MQKIIYIAIFVALSIPVGAVEEIDWKPKKKEPKKAEVRAMAKVEKGKAKSTEKTSGVVKDSTEVEKPVIFPTVAKQTEKPEIAKTITRKPRRITSDSLGQARSGDTLNGRLRVTKVTEGATSFQSGKYLVVFTPRIKGSRVGVVFENQDAPITKVVGSTIYAYTRPQFVDKRPFKEATVSKNMKDTADIAVGLYRLFKAIKK